MPLIDPIQVEGLRDFVRGVRELDAGAAKGIRLAANEAADIVVQAARSKTPQRSGKAAGSIKAKSTRSAARVTSGGRRAPYMPWLDYGGRVGRRKQIERPFVKEGRYVYPAFNENRNQVAETFKSELLRIADSAGLEVE